MVVPYEDGMMTLIKQDLAGQVVPTQNHEYGGNVRRSRVSEQGFLKVRGGVGCEVKGGPVFAEQVRESRVAVEIQIHPVDNAVEPICIEEAYNRLDDFAA